MGPEEYLDLNSPDPTPERTFYFIMNCLLYSRLEVGEEGKDGFEDDVNVYLANLLRSFMDPVFLQQSRPLLSDYDYEVFDRLKQSQDARLKYTVYKTNADFLLVSLGVFDSEAASSSERSSKNAPPASASTQTSTAITRPGEPNDDDGGGAAMGVTLIGPGLSRPDCARI